MKNIIISFFVLALLSGCKSSLSNSDKANKYVLLFSNDKAETFDTSSFVYYNAAGEITSEDDFDGTLFTQLTEYKNKLIANNGQEIVESTNGKVKTIKYKKQLDAYSSDLESFEYNNQLFWFTHGGVSGVYNSYLFCYDTQNTLTMSNGAVFGYLLDKNFVYVIMGNDWHDDTSKNTAMKVVKIDLDKFEVVDELISDTGSDITMNLLEQGKNIFDENEILFSISLPNNEDDGKRNPSYLYSFSLKDGGLTKLLNLSEFGIDTGKDETYYINNSFVYNNALYFFLRNGDLFKISKDKKYQVEKVLTLPDCLIGSISTYRVIDNHLVCVYNKNASENRYSLIEYDLENYQVVEDILLEKVSSLLTQKYPVGVLKK